MDKSTETVCHSIILAKSNIQKLNTSQNNQRSKRTLFNTIDRNLECNEAYIIMMVTDNGRHSGELKYTKVD